MEFRKAVPHCLPFNEVEKYFHPGGFRRVTASWEVFVRFTSLLRVAEVTHRVALAPSHVCLKAHSGTVQLVFPWDLLGRLVFCVLPSQCDITDLFPR